MTDVYVHDMVVVPDGRLGVVAVGDGKGSYTVGMGGGSGPYVRFPRKQLRQATPEEIDEAGLQGIPCNHYRGGETVVPEFPIVLPEGDLYRRAVAMATRDQAGGALEKSVLAFMAAWRENAMADWGSWWADFRKAYAVPFGTAMSVDVEDLRTVTVKAGNPSK